MKPSTFFVLCALVLPGLAGAKQADSWDGSRTTPVHRFPMFDENASLVVPSYGYAMPMSTKYTCGTCHNYATISNGWHFNSTKAAASPARPGEPWVLVDRRTGTQLPLSYRGTPGVWKPQDAGLTAWEFTKAFGHHLPGGDMAEPDEDCTSDTCARWEVSGKIEINCLACHNASHRQDPSEWAKQIGRENFRWAITVASGLGDVDGMASRLPRNWCITDGPNPDDKEFAAVPTVSYDLRMFDQKNRTVFDIVHKPSDNSCLQCHSVSVASVDKWQVDGDVHGTAGMKCVSCHRNDLGHMITRGYEGEAKDRSDASLADFTCRGCHVGHADAQPDQAAGGRLGAPRPKHAGIPPVHFEKMACTVCHSGPKPEAEPSRVRASRANRLGIHGRAQWFTDMPSIAEPVFVRGQDGVIAPHRMMWPAFWARVEGDKVSPLKPEIVAEAGKGVLDTQERIAAVLAALTAEGDDTTPVLVAGGKIVQRDANGELQASDYTGTATVASPMWARLQGTEIIPLVPAFDPAAERLDSNTEEYIVRTLDALAPIYPHEEIVLRAANKLYRTTTEGSLEATETSCTPAACAECVRVNAGVTSSLLSEQAVLNAVQTIGCEQSITEAQVALVLKALTDQQRASGKPQCEFIYVSGGMAFRLGEGGQLAKASHPAAAPVSWPVGHDVRPAGQALGAKSCMECHAENSPYFFAQVKAAGPLKTDSVEVKPMYEFQKLDGDFQRLFGKSFQMRSFGKTVLFAAAGLIAAILLVFVLLALRRAVQFLGVRE